MLKSELSLYLARNILHSLIKFNNMCHVNVQAVYKIAENVLKFLHFTLLLYFILYMPPISDEPLALLLVVSM